MDSYLPYLKTRAKVPFNVKEFYKHFQFSQKADAERIFRRCIGTLKRDDDLEIRAWAHTIASDDFEILDRLDVKEYWRALLVTDSRKDASASAETAIYQDLELMFNNISKKKRKLSDSSSTCNISSENFLVKFPLQQYCVAGCDIARKLYDLQKLAIESIKGETKKIQIETSIYELMAIQHVLLLKPDQHNDAMIDIFGAETLDELHNIQMDKWLSDCPTFSHEEFKALSKIIDDYQTQEAKLKDTVIALINMTKTMGKVKTAVINSIRRLVEKLPLKTSLDPLTSETEIWSKYADPVLDSLLSSPEEQVHLRWTNLKISSDDNERPDGIISVMNQLRWKRTYGHGEVKVEGKTDNVHALCWDLCRLAFFNKSQINDTNTRSAFAFQIKGCSMKAYVTELAHDGVYFMSEFAALNIPDSVECIDTMVTLKALRTLSHITFVFDKILHEQPDQGDEIQQQKRPGPTLPQLDELISKQRDRTLPGTIRF